MRSTTWLALFLTFSLGCGSTTPQPVDQVHTDEPHEEEEPEALSDGMSIEGIHGTLRRDEVDPVLNRAAGRFAECYAAALEDHPYLVGDLALQFDVNRDGTVESVWTRSATLGSRDVEECILRHARSLRFPRPHGGTAEVGYGPMVMNPGEEERPPELWDANRISEQLEEHRDALLACIEGARGFRATLYIGPRGRVRSVGVVAPSMEQQDAARCLEGEISGWQDLPDTGSWVAKVSLEL